MRFCVLVGLVATLALASGQTVEFPIGYYSYDEIARMMSTAHRQVECAPELKGRVALLRLNAAAALPRWYTARAARLGYDEATRALGREVPVHIYETYIVGSARLIGVCRARNGTVEVALR